MNMIVNWAHSRKLSSMASRYDYWDNESFLGAIAASLVSEGD